MKIFKARKGIAYFKSCSLVDIFTETNAIESTIPVNFEDEIMVANLTHLLSPFALLHRLLQSKQNISGVSVE